jgi:fatty-acid peroxygenase
VLRLGDDSLSLLTQGYAFLPNRRHAEGRETVRLGLLGRTAVAGLGPDWARRFYDERYVVRAGAMPGLVRNTLVGEGAVHTLDGEEHRTRKALFLRSLDERGVSSLAHSVLAAWDRAEPRWRECGQIVLFLEAADVLLDAVWDWAGLPTGRPAGTTTDMLAMVDAFGAVGPRNLRGRRARARQEQLLRGFVEEVRAGRRTAPPGSFFDAASWLRGADGGLVDPRVAAVEILNLVRPTVATAWFVAYAAHALARHPELRDGLASAEPVPVRSFAHEVRRFYPFAPFVGGTAATEARWGDLTVRRGELVVLDLYGQNHSADLWPEPYTFDPCRFDGLDLDPYTLVPQGGGRVEHGHRCPGEPGVVSILEVLVPRLARLEYDVPEQDDRIPLTRVPARPRSGMVLRLRAA